jgi:hypothetical protein
MQCPESFQTQTAQKQLKLIDQLKQSMGYQWFLVALDLEGEPEQPRELSGP